MPPTRARRALPDGEWNVQSFCRPRHRAVPVICHPSVSRMDDGRLAAPVPMKDEETPMALVELPDIAAGIALVRPEDADSVREGVPSKLAALRPILRGGRLGSLGSLVRDVRTLFEMLTDRSYPVPWQPHA